MSPVFMILKAAEVLTKDEQFLRSYQIRRGLHTYGMRRNFIGSVLRERHCTLVDIEAREQLRRYFDAAQGIPHDPDDSTFDKYDYMDTVLDLPQPKPKKAKSIMDRNLAALLRSDAKTVHVKLPASAADNTPRKARTYTYVSHLPLAVGDSVVVQAAGETKIGLVELVDNEAKIEPGCDTEYFWIIDKVDMAAYEANKQRNDEITAEAAVIVRENMRKSFAAQVLGAASDAQRTKLLQLTGNAA